jgi:hypothetical protein
MLKKIIYMWDAGLLSCTVYESRCVSQMDDGGLCLEESEIEMERSVAFLALCIHLKLTAVGTYIAHT